MSGVNKSHRYNIYQYYILEMATSLSNETSTTSLLELSQTPLPTSTLPDISYTPSSKTNHGTTSRSDQREDSAGSHTANATPSSNQTSTTSGMKNRGDSLSSSQSYQQQQSSLIQNAGLAYPFIYPPPYLSGFASTSSSAQYNYPGSVVGSGSMSSSQSSAGTNSRRGGKKKAPTTQTQNPELRLFFNLRRKDCPIQANKGQSHVYKPKNPPQLSEWFKRLTTEERVNALSTVCQHLTETFITMYHRTDKSGPSSFACMSLSSDCLPYSSPSYYSSGYQRGSSSLPDQLKPWENFYQRPYCDTELQQIKTVEKEKFEAEQEILSHVRLTDFLSYLDTFTVTEEFVADADNFFKLMALATGNAAFSSLCVFEMKASGVPSIEQPSWFKPKSFNSFATWIIVALEENLWAHYNYDNNANLGSVKANDLQTLFREKTDSSALDIDLVQLSTFWRDTSEKDRRALIDQFKNVVAKEAESECNGYTSGHSKNHKVVHAKNMQYQVTINQKNDKDSYLDSMDKELSILFENALKAGSEQEFLTGLIYTQFQFSSQKLVELSRKLLDLIKKRYKDDLMENLLQEEDQKDKSAKPYKKKNKKKNFNNALQSQQQQQQQQQAVPSSKDSKDKGAQSSTEVIGAVVTSSDTQTEEVQAQAQLKLKGGKKKRGKHNTPLGGVGTTGGKSSQEKSHSITISVTPPSEEQPQSAPLNNMRTLSPPTQEREKGSLLAEDEGSLRTISKSSSHVREAKLDDEKTQGDCYLKKTAGSETENDEKLNSSRKLRIQEEEIVTDEKEEDTLESDNKNSSIDTKSSINLFELATPHQSVISTANSSATNKQTQKERVYLRGKAKQEDEDGPTSAGQILQIQQSKSANLNQSSFKQKTFNSSPYSKQQQKGSAKGDFIEKTEIPQYGLHAPMRKVLPDNVDLVIKAGETVIEDQLQVESSKPQGVGVGKTTPQKEKANGKSPSQAQFNSQTQRADNSSRVEGSQRQEGAGKKKNQQQKQSHALATAAGNNGGEGYNGAGESQDEQPHVPRKNNDHAKKQSHHEGAISTSGKEDNVNDKNKKKRKKKGTKLTEADAMNNFMKNLHQHQDEHKDSMLGNYSSAGNGGGGAYYQDRYFGVSRAGEGQQYKKKVAPSNADTRSNASYNKYLPQASSSTKRQSEEFFSQEAFSSLQQQQSNRVPAQQDSSNNGSGTDDPKTVVAQKTYKQKSTPKEQSSVNQNQVESSFLSPRQIPEHDTVQPLDDQGVLQKPAMGARYGPKIGKHHSSRMSDTPIEDKTAETKSNESLVLDDKAKAVAQHQSEEAFHSDSMVTSNQRSNAFRQLQFQATALEGGTEFRPDISGSQPLVPASLGLAGGVGLSRAGLSDSLIEKPSTGNHLAPQHQQQPPRYQSYQNTPNKQPPSTHPKNYHKQMGSQINEHQQDTASYRTPPQISKNKSSQSAYGVHHGGGSNVGGGGAGNAYRKSHHNTIQHNGSNYGSQNLGLDGQYQLNPSSQIASNSAQASSHNGVSSKMGGGTKLSNQAQYRPSNRPSTTSQHNNVYIQSINLSQSMQEQQSFMQAFVNPESTSMYYPEHQPNFMIGQAPNVDTFSKPQSQQPDCGIFQYVEKNPMVIQQPIPCYSPNQFQMNQFAPPQGTELIPNPFTYNHRVNSQVAPYFDQSQDLIFQIFNSIKSNHSHSMSPIPSIIPSPQLLEYQLSQSSEMNFQPQRIDQQAFGQQEAFFYQTLDNEIEAFCAQIQTNISLLKPERDYVYNKLATITSQVFHDENPKLELFGSLITGLALESSDMDLAVTGLLIDDRFVMVSDLNKLASALQDWKCLESFKSIDTASIPVIKMKVDLVKLREQEMPQLMEGDFAARPIPEEQRYLSVDITFDDSPVSQFSPQSIPVSDILSPSGLAKTHLGLQSCALVQQYINNYKSLKQVAILLKKFLALHQFNHPYYGGISSYSTVILIVSYMNYYGLRGSQELSPSRLLMGFLDFYGNYFNPGSMGISVFDDGSFYQLNGPPDSYFVILDPLNLQNNTTRNSYLTKDILLKFQCAFDNLKSLMYKLPQLQQAVLSSTTAFARASSQDEKSSIHFERASPQPTHFQPPASNMQQTSNNQYKQNIKIEPEEGCDQIPQRNAMEENEASDLALGAVKESQIVQSLMCQVSLLETFFAKDTLPIADLNGVSPSQQETRGTQFAMIEEAHVQ